MRMCCRVLGFAGLLLAGVTAAAPGVALAAEADGPAANGIPTAGRVASGPDGSGSSTGGSSAGSRSAGGPAPAGPATSGSATSGSATSGPANSGSATSGPANSSRATGGPAAGGTASGGGTTVGKVPDLPSLIAYVRDGNVLVSRGTSEKRLTGSGHDARPRWSPDGKRIAFLRDEHLWTMNADGTGAKQLTTRSAAGPSWSPDGKWIAFASLSCTGGPGVYRISAAGPGTPQVLFPRECQDEDLPDEQPPSPKQSGTPDERLSTDDAVAWSPDGSKVAFRGGECDAIYDSCLSIGNLATGGEKTIAAYGGGSLETKGFAVVPSWRPDGAKLAFTAYQKGETSADDQPVHLVEYDTATGRERTVGGAQDREMAYLGTDRGVLTGQSSGHSWIVVVGLSTGSRTLFHAGSQPSVQPCAVGKPRAK